MCKSVSIYKLWDPFDWLPFNWLSISPFLFRNKYRNNHVEGLNQRLKCHFTVHPHIFKFIELLREEYEYRHYKSEESRVQLRKPKKVNDAIDENLELLLNDHNAGLITGMQLAIKCRRSLTTKLVEWCFFLCYPWIKQLIVENLPFLNISYSNIF